MASTRLSLKPGAIELLDALDDLRLPRAIATSSAHHTVEHHLTAHNLAGRFHEIVGYGDYASGKPAPDPFLKAAERLGVEPRLCLALEDSHNGVRSASSAGMITIMVPDLLEPTDEIRGLCTFVARDLHEVRSLILGSVPCRLMSGSNGWFSRRRKYRSDIHRDAGYARLRETLDSKAGLVGKGK